MTDLQKEDLEEMRGSTIDARFKYGVLTLLFAPTIKTWGDASSFAAANRDRIKPVVLEVLMEMLEDQCKKMKDGRMPKTILEDAPVVEEMIEYVPILE